MEGQYLDECLGWCEELGLNGLPLLREWLEHALAVAYEGMPAWVLPFRLRIIEEDVPLLDTDENDNIDAIRDAVGVYLRNGDNDEGVLARFRAMGVPEGSLLKNWVSILCLQARAAEPQGQSRR